MVCKETATQSFLSVVIILLVAQGTQATDHYWNTTPPNYNWFTAGFWDGTTPRTIPTASDDAYIDNGGTSWITQPGATCKDLYLGRTNSSASGTVELSGDGTLSDTNAYIGHTGTGTFTQSGGTHTVSTALNLGQNVGSSGIYNLAGGTLILKSLSKGSGSGAFNFGGGTLRASGAFSTALPMTLTGAGGTANIDTSTFTITLTGALTGTGGLNKLGSGTLSLEGIYTNTDTFSGDTTISAGTIDLKNNVALQNSTVDNSGGTLNLKVASPTLGALKGNHPLSLTWAISPYADYAVPLSVGKNGQSTTFSGNITGLGSLTKIGSGTLALQGTNSYGGTTAVSAGILLAKKPESLSSYSATGKVTVSNAATLAVNAGGANEWLAANIQTLLIKTTFNSGNSGSIFGIDTSNASGGNFNYGNPIGGKIGFAKFGAGTLTLTSANTYTDGTTINGGTLQLGNGTDNGSVVGNIVNNAALIFNNGTAQTYANIISGSGNLTKIGTGTLTLTNANIFNGDTTINGGTLQLGDGTVNGSVAGNIVNNAALIFDNGTAQTYAATISGSGNLTKTGTGTLTLSGPISYSGTTTINEGTLQFTQESVTLSDVVGMGELLVGDGVNPTVLTANTINVGTLTIGSGGKAATHPVPEPSTLVSLVALLAAGLLMLKGRIYR